MTPICGRHDPRPHRHRRASIGGNVWLTNGVPPGSRITQAEVRDQRYPYGGGIRDPGQGAIAPKGNPSLAYHQGHVELPRFIEEPIPAIIEIATGLEGGTSLDKKSGLLIVDRILFSSVHYPANYGFVPRTY